ncbi:glycerophosphodiester phosphodiesterase [Sphaerisporangium sp. TRM90804]|uniref:glycerophosphodiester phosphodiesterase n=1 Tax=Sphaerisporangium sp. TRM90804 TaxID=3031113 RepID=UPI00244BBC82|nr:glycerophosphodiester phosphodiesterase [Sphaerisporangium sp. TRM90804]MDH2427541.1 glycerophosphodiester phosphodiesterase [Sphaerisporangium sp. TRM90804]
MIIIRWLLAGAVSIVPPVAPADAAGPFAVTTPAGAAVPRPGATPPGAGAEGTAGGKAPEPRPAVIGHRGACAYRPEHTLLSYETAIRMGADFIEPDLVSTKDHVLVTRHENEISQTTDVARHPEFASRRTTKVIDGRTLTGWFTEDFTLAELNTLRAVERLPGLRPVSAAYDGRERVATFEQVVALARRRGVGVYPETKHPGYFAAIGLPLERPMLATLARHGWRERSDPVFVQSFETANLKAMRGSTRLRLVQLLEASGAPRDLMAAGDPRTYRDLATPAGLREIATYADAVGAHTHLLVPQDSAGRRHPATTLVRDAHDAGLKVHVWTVRPENSHLPADFRTGDPASPGHARAHGDMAGWLRELHTLGVDGVFTDDPGVARRVRDTPG